MMKTSTTQQSGQTLLQPVMQKVRAKHQRKCYMHPVLVIFIKKHMQDCHICIISCQSFVAVTTRKKRCGQCHGCTLPDCSQCSYCKDMRKFGGPGRKKKGCIQRKCTFYENEKVNYNKAQKLDYTVSLPQHTVITLHPASQLPPSQQPPSQDPPSQDPLSQPSSSYSPTLPELPSLQPSPARPLHSTILSLTSPPISSQSQCSAMLPPSTS